MNLTHEVSKLKLFFFIKLLFINLLLCRQKAQCYQFLYQGLSFIQGIIHLVRTQNFRKTDISYPLIRTRTCAHQGVKNVDCSEKFTYVLNKWSLKAFTWKLFSWILWIWLPLAKLNSVEILKITETKTLISAKYSELPEKMKIHFCKCTVIR